MGADTKRHRFSLYDLLYGSSDSVTIEPSTETSAVSSTSTLSQAVNMSAGFDHTPIFIAIVVVAIALCIASVVLFKYRQMRRKEQLKMRVRMITTENAGVYADLSSSTEDMKKFPIEQV